jgi:phenylalanyl-tRNA synthetase beta chain
MRIVCTHDFIIDYLSIYQQLLLQKARNRGETTEPKIVYKIDIPANRYDLLCVEGLVRALNVFLSTTTIPNFHYSTPNPVHRITVQADTQSIRPYLVGAILRNVTLDHQRYNSFLDLQDKLHFNICRRRTLVAIGTHDLDSIEGPFSYEV